MSTQAIIAEGVPLFSGSTIQEREALYAMLRPPILQCGVTNLSAGDRGEALYIISAGGKCVWN